MRTLLLQCPHSDSPVLTELLAETGFDVKRVESLEEAISAHEDVPFDLALLCDRETISPGIATALRAHTSRSALLIAGLLPVDSGPALNAKLRDHLDDCLALVDSGESLRVRLEFLLNRLQIRARHLNQIARSELKVRAILETTVEGIITIDVRGTVESLNRAAEKIFGHKASDVIGQNISMLMPEPYSSRHDQYVNNYLSGGPAKIIGIGREVSGRRRDGTVFPMELAVSEFEVDGERMFTGVVRDITERRQLEQEILRISEMERQRIGQDLHDGLGQTLTGIGLISQNTANQMRESHPEAAAEVDRITRLIRDADQQSRTIARSLVPVEVESNGLSYALQQLAMSTSQVHDLSCRFDDPEQILVGDAHVASHLYRIAQEAVSNATRHARASEMQILLETDEGELILEIRDNGNGFQKPTGQRSGMGLGIMTYRARMLGGELSVTENPSGGVCVRCTLPIT